MLFIMKIIPNGIKLGEEDMLNLTFYMTKELFLVLKTNGRIESILISMPPKAYWNYNHNPKLGSEEEKLIKILKTPKNWI